MNYALGALGLSAAAYYGLAGGESPLKQNGRPRPSQDPKQFVGAPKDKDEVRVVAPDGEINVRFSKEGVASRAPITVMSQFKAAVNKNGNQVALRVEREGRWIEWTWNQYYDEALRAGKSMIAAGLKPSESVNVIGFNSPEWLFANMGAIAAGGKAAGIYTTNEPEACKYISEHSNARVVVVENQVQLAKFLKIRDDLPNLSALVVYADSVPAGANQQGKCPVYDWKQFMALGDKVQDSELAARIDRQRPGHACTLIYTSGTTGNPKAVMISHDNITWTAQALFESLPAGFGDGDEHLVSYLPLSHIAAQMLDLHLPMSIAALLPGNATVHFARPDALKGTLGETLRAVRPTFFFGVPRVWEKIADKMKAIGAQTTGVKKQIASWAKSLGAQASAEEEYGRSFQLPWGFPVAKKLVLDKVRQALGLDRCDLCFTGAAPISKETLNYFASLYLPIYELYGMSECTGPHTLCYPSMRRTGSCGVAMTGAEMKIDHDPTRDAPGEGEICYRGRHVMMGYMTQMDKTKEAIDDQGWLHSGDVGRVDGDGFLFITGRIKELIITAGGENIAPVPWENELKRVCPGIANACVIGDKRKYLVVLVTLACEQKADGSFGDKLVGESAKVSANSSTVTQAQNDPAWQQYLERGLKEANATVVSRAAKVQKFAILPTDFSVPGGELTSTLKLRRKIVHEKYDNVIEKLYK